MTQIMPRWLQVSFFIVLAYLILIVLLSLEHLDMYGNYFRHASPAITVRFAELSTDMDEAAVRKHFEGVLLRCVAQPIKPVRLGDRVCYTYLDQADGDAALVLMTYFVKGKLVRAVVQVPWWVHGAWVERFNGQFGSAEKIPGLLRWKIPNGQIEFNKSRSWNLLEVNAILWTGR